MSCPKFCCLVKILKGGKTIGHTYFTEAYGKTTQGSVSLQPKSLANTVEKEIAHYESFLLFPQCFLPFWGTFCHFHQA